MLINVGGKGYRYIDSPSKKYNNGNIY